MDERKCQLLVKCYQVRHQSPQKSDGYDQAKLLGIDLEFVDFRICNYIVMVNELWQVRLGSSFFSGL